MGYSIRRHDVKNERWTAYYMAPSGDKRSAGTFDTEREADKAWKRMEGRVLDDRWVDARPGKITFDEFVDEVYWPNYANVREASTRAAYYYMLKSHLRPKFGKVPLSAITPEMVQGWVGELGRKVSPQTKKPLSPATVRKNVALLSKILNVAIKTRRITLNSCFGTELQTVPVPDLKVITPEQFDVLYAAIPEEHRMLVEVAIETGFRWGEIAELRRSDFDSTTRIITCQRTVVEASTKATGEATRYTVKDYPKGRKPRRVKISKPVAARLSAHILAHGLGADDLFFSTPRKTHLSRNNFRTRIWIEARRKAGLSETTMHGLRHAHASWLIAAGRSLQEVKERLGHATIATTEKYLHTVDVETDALIDDFSAFRNRGTTKIKKAKKTKKTKIA